MNESRLYRRIARRERFASRSTAVVIVLALVAVSAIYVGTECVLAALGRPALAVTPADALGWIAGGGLIVSVVAATVAILGIVLLVLAVTPGRRARHVVPSERLVVVVDDAVIAGALARDARLAASVAGDRIHASVSSRRANVVVTPTSGIRVEESATRHAVEELVGALDARPRIRPTVHIAETGRIGS